jgi:hypothetical protein
MLADGGQTGLADVLERSRVSQLLRIPRWSYPAAGKPLACLLHRYYSFITLLASLRVDRYAGPLRTMVRAAGRSPWGGGA